MKVKRRRDGGEEGGWDLLRLVSRRSLNLRDYISVLRNQNSPVRERRREQKAFKQSFSYGSGIGDYADFDVCTSNSSRSNFQHAQTPRLLTYSCLFNLSCVSRGHLTSVAGNSRPRESCRFQMCP